MKKISLSLVVVIFLVLLAAGVSLAAANTTYLPIVQRAPNTPTPTPTQTPTPTPTPNPNPIALPNGGFESGRVTWHEYSNMNHVLILQNSDIAHSGSWYAQLGGTIGDIESIDQSVLIPVDHPWLSFWRSIISTETACTNDFYKIYIDNTLIDNYGLCDKDNSGWHRKAYDLSAYKGQTVKLTINVTTNSSLNSTMFVDDFEFRVAGLTTP
jgi:serine protease AprX